MKTSRVTLESTSIFLSNNWDHKGAAASHLLPEPDTIQQVSGKIFHRHRLLLLLKSRCSENSHLLSPATRGRILREETMDPDSDSKPASFTGRLQLQDFMHAPDASPSPRRSPRVSSILKDTKPSPALPSPSPLASSKRKSPSSASTPSSSTSPTKRPRNKTAGYAPPSTYAHLPLLPDAIAPNLLILFIGLNPGIQTATCGHAYAHPSNLFWKLLHSSGITPDRLVPASEDRSLPERYALGLTNIVARPSRNGSELSKAEMDAGVAVLEEKIARWRPEVVCVVGKSIWESVFRVRRGRGMRKEEFRYGWQGEGENMGVVEEGDEVAEDGVEGVERGPWPGAKVFVATSTSGLAATLRPAEKEAIWAELGTWCQDRRREREVADA